MSRRLSELLRRQHEAAEVDRALASLVMHVDADDVLTISRDHVHVHGTPFFEGDPRSPIARIAPNVYSQTPTEEARIRLLERAADLAERIEVHAALSLDNTHRGRIVFDVPRRIARALGVATAEPGDRFAPEYVHAFFDDEQLIVEASHAALGFVGRRGAWIIFERALPTEERADTFAIELARVSSVVRKAERQRRHETPQRAIEAMRASGRRRIARGPIGRARLRRAIGWADWLGGFSLGVGDPNCFRRTLVEIALDRGAAEETLVFGLDVGKTGHVAFKDAEDRAFDVAFEFPP